MTCIVYLSLRIVFCIFIENSSSFTCIEIGEWLIRKSFFSGVAVPMPLSQIIATLKTVLYMFYIPLVVRCVNCWLDHHTRTTQMYHQCVFCDSMYLCNPEWNIIWKSSYPYYNINGCFTNDWTYKTFEKPKKPTQYIWNTN